MGLDHEIGATRRAARPMRWRAHLALGTIAIGMLMTMGVGTQAAAEPQPATTLGAALTTSAAAGTAGAAMAGAHSSAWRTTESMADRSMHTGGIPAVEGASLVELSRASSAERHIQIGMLLIIVSLMAATSFSLWRWQLRGLISEAAHHDA
ncbi:hypothetical protein AX760_02670 [Pararhizobium antarcticum]|uniref:Transmembrane protein n=2 Tax=Pararhizobium antarcticum TaxID=1798805 RepID=A0A657LS33_9HYPH|nr:hypothetical protein AX760_02670 [Pararhizobium antarcticum]OJF98965.1 hypothetical protein AX761_12115 [Rhizobium sp. 58]